MKHYDFMIAYEHKNRELESICLIKGELDRLGYKTIVYNVSDEEFKWGKKRYYTKVLILPYGYGDGVLSYAVKQSILFEKIINLQWEQALTREQEDDIFSYKTPSGCCKYAVHIAWGMANYNRLVNKAKLPEQNVKVCGNVSLDFTKSPFCERIYKGKKQLMTEYSLDSEKKVYLFISSFKAAFLDGEHLQHEIEIYGNNRYIQHEIMLKSFKQSMQWIENLLEKIEEDIFIYRPHPGEQQSWSDEIRTYMDALCAKHKNFKIIGGESVRQWIYVADRIYVGVSTSVSEIYAMGKDCGIIYPVELPEMMTGRLLDDSKVITNEREFLEYTINGNKEFPVPIENLTNYYGDFEKISYLNVVKTCVEVLNDDMYLVPASERNRIYYFRVKGLSLIDKLKHVFFQSNFMYVYRVVYKIRYRVFYFTQKAMRIKADEERLKEWKTTELVSKGEIENIENKLAYVFQKEIEGELGRVDLAALYRAF